MQHQWGLKGEGTASAREQLGILELETCLSQGRD